MVASNTAADTLVSVVYVSSARKELGPSELTELLSKARIKNQRDGITGMLLYRGGNFLQVIEGKASSVDLLLQSLQRDTRHSGMLVMKRIPIEERQFGEWQMAFRDIDGADLTNLEGYSPFLELSFIDPAVRATPSAFYKLLLQFREKIR